MTFYTKVGIPASTPDAPLTGQDLSLDSDPERFAWRCYYAVRPDEKLDRVGMPEEVSMYDNLLGLHIAHACMSLRPNLLGGNAEVLF